jgi:hypothetical protein
MKKVFLLVCILTVFVIAKAQNVGIGTSTPQAKLEIKGAGNTDATDNLILKNSTDDTLLRILDNGRIGIGYNGSFYGRTLNIGGTGINFFNGSNGVYGGAIDPTDTSLVIWSNNSINSYLILQPTGFGNVGIGTNKAQYKLDLGGRLRIQNSSNTAGIWFDGTSNPIRSFIGTIDNDHVGIYGNGGAGWKFAFNVNNGNVGVGTSVPTASLDVNGSIRMRGTFPKKGSVLTSDDANGNANWSDPVAFKTDGLLNNTTLNITENSWTKVMFKSTPTYNLGLNYQSVLSQFLVAENGIYHLNTQLTFPQPRYIKYGYVRFMIDRGGTIFEIGRFEKGARQYDGTQLGGQGSIALNGEYQLIQGDIVWVEVWGVGFSDVNGNIFSSMPISAAGNLTWFSGHLIARN